MVTLLVRFRVMEIGKALLSTQDLSRCGWETVFPAGCGDAYLIRKASNTRITLVKKRCAWYLRAKLKPHHELPFTKGEEFLEVMSMDQGAGVWPVFEGGKFKQQWSNCPRGCRGEHASEEARDAFSTDSRRTRRAHSQRARSVQNLVSRMLHRTRKNASTPHRRKGNCDTSDCH